LASDPKLSSSNPAAVITSLNIFFNHISEMIFQRKAQT
jgi:hypothetical protein